MVRDDNRSRVGTTTRGYRTYCSNKLWTQPLQRGAVHEQSAQGWTARWGGCFMGISIHTSSSRGAAAAARTPHSVIAHELHLWAWSSEGAALSPATTAPSARNGRRPPERGGCKGRRGASEGHTTAKAQVACCGTFSTGMRHQELERTSAGVTSFPSPWRCRLAACMHAVVKAFTVGCPTAGPKGLAWSEPRAGRRAAARLAATALAAGRDRAAKIRCDCIAR